MSQVKDQVKNLQAQSFGVSRGDGTPTRPLVVTPAHYQWMQRPSREKVYTPEAIEFGLVVLRGEDYIPREPGEQRLSPSAVAEDCGRRALFNYGGAPKAPEEVKSQDLMDGGSFLHLKWQMEGLSAPWLAKAEVWGEMDYRGKKLIAKIDGELTDGGLFELKTKGAWVMRAVVDAPLWEHEMQFEAYCLVLGYTEGSIVYLNRDTGEFKEHRLVADSNRRRQLEAHLDDLVGWIDLDRLPDMLEPCTKREGNVYRRCPYREFCPAAGKVSTVGALRS